MGYSLVRVAAPDRDGRAACGRYRELLLDRIRRLRGYGRYCREFVVDRRYAATNSRASSERRPKGLPLGLVAV
jgi:hypothetical protein